jgi:diphosphomevalonate decarboxylase
MPGRSATAVASSNIALIKYWGNRDDALRLPSSGSISITLAGLETRTTVTFKPEHVRDELELNGNPASPQALRRVSQHLDLVRRLSGLEMKAHVRSTTSFPPDAGLASSASAFAALTVAACAAAGVDLEPRALSRLARRGSGSACRSIFGGFVEWLAGQDDETSFAEPLAPPEHWPLMDLVAIVSREHKLVGSTTGHNLAATSPLQSARVADAPRRLAECRQAILSRDFDGLARLTEQDSNMMHAVMITSTPPLLYWAPDTLTVMHTVTAWREAGRTVCYSVDAGPNVHCLCTEDEADRISQDLRSLPGVLDVLSARPGGPARLV